MNPKNANIIQLYHEGLGTIFIAQKLGIHRSTVQRVLKRSGICLRKRSPTHHYNVAFFSTFNKWSSYWAGFLMADGCVRKSCVHVKLGKQDKDHLEKLLSVISSNYRVKDAEKYCYVDIAGQWFVDDLSRNFGITHKKTYVTSFPEIPYLCERDFIRGVFDGDGCITYTTCPTINFTGTTELLNAIMLKINSAIDIRLKSGNLHPPIQITKANIGQVSYSGKNAKKILDWLYEGSDKTIRLTRKYRKYLAIFEVS